MNNGYNILRISDEVDFQNNIICSELTNIFDFSKIDWNRCLQHSSHTYVKEICDIKYNNPEYSISDIMKISHFSESSIRRWLKIGTKLGWCNYDPKQELINGMYKKDNNSYKKKAVICLDNGKIFNSISECARVVSHDFGCDISRKCVSMVCNNKRIHTHGHHFKFVLDLNVEEYEYFHVEEKLKVV